MSTNNNQQNQVKLLRGGSFVQPNTVAAPAAVLQDDTLSAEDLHAYTRTSTIMLRPTILNWRTALNSVAEQISQETKKPVNQIRSAPPDTIRVIDFKPPPPVTFKGIHRVDGTLNFQWQDRDAALGGVYQPKVVVDKNQEKEKQKEEQNNKKNGDDDNIHYSAKQRKLWQSHELGKTDKLAFELLRQHWRDVGRRTKLELLQKLNAANNTNSSLENNNSQNSSSGGIVVGLKSNNNIRQREEGEEGHTNEIKKPSNSADPKKNKQQQAETTSAMSTGGEDDLEAILRRAQEALGL